MQQGRDERALARKSAKGALLPNILVSQGKSKLFRFLILKMKIRNARTQAYRIVRTG